MTKVITYGTYDLLHRGHIRLLERAKALGDYLVVGVTSDDFDRARGKINVQQSLIERIAAVRETGLADEIIVEEYEGQKIDDIKRLGIDIFTVGNDWVGNFDYLNEFCKVVYLPRTQGVSSTQIRSDKRALRMGLVGSHAYLAKFLRESAYVNGIDVRGVFSSDVEVVPEDLRDLPVVTEDYDELLDSVDAVFLISHPSEHYEQIRKALEAGVHVLCESPVVTDPDRERELRSLAQSKGCVLVNALRTAYSMAYERLLLLVKSGRIGQVRSVDAACTSLRAVDVDDERQMSRVWNSICEWGPTALLPVFQLLGTEYLSKRIVTHFADPGKEFDSFTKIDFLYPHAVASIKVGKGAKSEGDLVITGTCGYVYVPSPWWKTEYFEVRYEDLADTKRYFYKLDGEGIRYMLVDFLKQIQTGKTDAYIDDAVSLATSGIIADFYAKNDLFELA
ncbi:adenylyltransferase/cytidyltransferase family protein [Curtanaerobium respiraculi]|uniref:adenylyltransferase/cytidyltransferase family protein n=1 Tax=Curtanaerobium respiraculi TaxID=2949669 RepID=UPI0024B32FC1|nr:adenylyltransferase/cytidyltransferase family protein [Curtanaerobium respiraculi]